MHARIRFRLDEIDDQAMVTEPPATSWVPWQYVLDHAAIMGSAVILLVGLLPTPVV